MTTPNHIAQSIAIQLAIYPKWYLVIIAMVLSAIPDIGRLFQKDKSDWDKFYVPAHKLTWYNLLIPYWNLHIVEDYFTHRHEAPYGWKDWAIYLEVVTDIILSIYLIIIFIGVI